MPLTRITRRIAPKIANSGLYVADTGASNSVTTITIPAGVLAVRIWFENGSGVTVRGRVGFAGEVYSLTVTDSDGTLGYQEADVEIYELPAWARVLYVASSTANAKVRGIWFYD